MKTHIKYIFSLILFIIIFPSQSYSDTLILKKGKPLTGFFLKEKGNKVLFQDTRGTQHSIFSKKIERLDIGFSGILACYSFKGKSKKNCNILFMNIDVEKEEVNIAVGKGFHDKKKIDMNKLGKVTLFLNKTPRPYIPNLPTNLPVSLTVKKKKRKGKIVQFSKFSITIRFKKDSFLKYSINSISSMELYFDKIKSQNKLENEEEKIDNQEVAKDTKKSKNDIERRISDATYLDYLIPGKYQFRKKNYLRGFGITIVMSSLAFLSFNEYQSSEKAKSDAKKNASRMNITDLDTRINRAEEIENRFETHKANQNNYNMLFLLAYGVNALDVYLSSRKRIKTQSTQSMQNRKNYRISWHIRPFSPQNHHNTYPKIQYLEKLAYPIESIGFSFASRL